MSVSVNRVRQLQSLQLLLWKEFRNYSQSLRQLLFLLSPRSSSLPPNKGLLMDFSSHGSINMTTSSTSISINILKINLAWTRAASHQLQNSVVNFNSDITLMQEPYSRAEKFKAFPSPGLSSLLKPIKQQWS
ncbi:hypothetical protein AVEN_68547-1 [Araneus ventricosus]|uniref:Endonuclease/exonuclease/phosphatase domain-containing protein n=1 Tax=Araneus ventricosus TaxID=182803 RepID=A0A4Y2HCR8_ARAVE|nr:hypothetical protein AVEN_68547-1 [Araneus ventricosus]